MKNKKEVKIGFIVVSIVLVLLAMFSATQAYFNTDTYAKNPNEYQSGVLSITANSKSNNINLTNALPMTDEEGSISEPYIFTIKNIGNVDYKFNIKLLSTSSNSISPNYIKLKVDDNEIVTLSSLSQSVIKKDVILKAGETLDITLRVWLDYNIQNTELGKEFNSKIVIDGESIYTGSNNEYNAPATPIDNFNYYLGSDSTTISNIPYYDSDTDATYNIDIEPIAIKEDEVLIVRYNGSDKNVVVPDTYVVDGRVYNVVIVSLIYVCYYDGDAGIDIDNDTGIFEYNENIESVVLGKNIKVFGQEEYGNADDLFYGCTNLVNAPEIPSSVTSMSGTFSGCTSLVNAPVIPSSVTDMYYTFNGCTNLTGTVKVNSTKVNYATDTFKGTTKSIALEVPKSSTTYTKFNASSLPSNVTLSTY